MCKTVYACSPLYTDFFALSILFYLMHTVLRKFLCKLCQNIFTIQFTVHYNTNTHTHKPNSFYYLH